MGKSAMLSRWLATEGNGYVYAMCMYSERLQILVSPEQRRMLDAEARQRGVSVAALIRDAVEEHLGLVDPRTRGEAIARIREMRGTHVPPDELNRIVEEELSRP